MGSGETRCSGRGLPPGSWSVLSSLVAMPVRCGPRTTEPRACCATNAAAERRPGGCAWLCHRLLFDSVRRHALTEHGQSGSTVHNRQAPLAPLVVQLVAWAAFWLAGLTGLLPAAATPIEALRFALAVMFAFTALSHFVPGTRADLVRMVPPAFPAPGLLISLTGLLELAGAIGLLLPPLTRPAALALALLLLALFPANVQAARSGLLVAGRPAMPLRFRLPLQLFWIACLLLVAAMNPHAVLTR